MPTYLKGAMISALFSISTALHASAVDRLSDLLTRHDAMQADFEQYTVSEEGARQEHSSGEFVLERPARFDWRTELPYEQRIVSDGEYIWIYDPDLEQVTRKSADNQVGSAPAMILSGNIDALEEQFDVRQIDETPEQEVFELTPQQPESGFVRIRLLFSGELLTELLLEDSLGQRTSIMFDDIQVDPAVDESRFTFVPPEGVDVILDPGV